MRSAIAVAAFAAGAIAVPYKRDVVTNYDMVYVTDVVTITAGQAQPYSTPSNDQPAHYGHHNHYSYSTSTIVEQAPATTPSSTYEAPLTTYVPAPTYEAPATTPSPSSSTPAPQEYSAPSSSSAASGAAPTSYQEIVVYHHNLHRANHSCEDVEWSDDLYSSAKEIAESCVYAHNTEVQGGGYGQNIAAGVEPANVSAIITDLFYNGEEPYFADLYGQANPDMTNFELWGHFSQIVWKGTTHVACYTQHCPGGLSNVGSDVAPYFTVCNYKSPGNYAGEYADNVLAPVGKASANWNTGLSSS